MSVVLDALKRAERERPIAIINTSLGSSPSTKTDIVTTKNSHKKTLLGITVLNCVAILATYFFLKPAPTSVTKLHVTPVPPITEASPIPQDIAAPEQLATVVSAPVSAPEIKKIKKKRNYLSIQNGPEIKIDGIFLDKNGAFVLFGDEMLPVGADMDGATITAITTNKVLLQYQGQDYAINT
jgi:hypothetical protein